MRNDFSKGKIGSTILSQAFPMMIAQLVHLLYNIVDRIYIGHMPGIGSMALTGIGLAFPITTLVAAFTNMFGMGGAPLFSIARGEKNDERAERILGQVTGQLIIWSVILFVVSYLFRKPILYLFGASDTSYPYADAYLKIYLFGTFFVMFSTGLNGFINAQGYPKIGMYTTVVGAVLNLILDPVFIFVFKMGVGGAALATVLSQVASAVWVYKFFVGNDTLYKIKKENMVPDFKIIREIATLGFANFIMQGTNTLVSIFCNVTLRTFGGDIYVGVMTVLNSVREIFQLPCNSITHGAQPILSFNYGAKRYDRVRESIRYMTFLSLSYLIFAWVLVVLRPSFWISVFTSDPELITIGSSALTVYFFGFAFMAFQSTGQNTFTSLKRSKHAIFFSLLRKVFIVVPLTLILPRMGFGVTGVWLAEPISNIIGGLACFTTMYFSVYRKLPQ